MSRPASGGDADRDVPDDVLRARVHGGDGRARVDAAFALALRLGRDALPELALADQGDPGVRAHFLTVLAGFGEREAVRAVAEHGSTAGERAHALRLALQLAADEPGWASDRLAALPTRDQAGLLATHADRFDLGRLTPVLLALLDDALDDVRRLAGALRLRLDPDVADPTLRAAALREPALHADVLAAWAGGPGHRALLDIAAKVRGFTPALDALVEAGRRYDLAELGPLAKTRSQLLALLRDQPTSPDARRALLAWMDEALHHDGFLTAPELDALRRGLPPPFSPDEAAVLARWRAHTEGPLPTEDDPRFGICRGAWQALAALGEREPVPEALWDVW